MAMTTRSLTAMPVRMAFVGEIMFFLSKQQQNCERVIRSYSGNQGVSVYDSVCTLPMVMPLHSFFMTVPREDDNVEHIGDDAKDADAQTEAAVHLSVPVDELQQTFIIPGTLVLQ